MAQFVKRREGAEGVVFNSSKHQYSFILFQSPRMTMKSASSLIEFEIYS